MTTIISFNVLAGDAIGLHRVEVDEPMDQVVSDLVAGWARVTRKGKGKGKGTGEAMAINPANVVHVSERPERRSGQFA